MNLGHLLRDSHRWKDAEHSYGEAVEIGEAVLAGEPSNVAFKKSLANEKENLAILLVARPDTPVYDPPRAARLAQEAIKLVPEKATFWAVLSLAQYRMGNWKASVDAMEKATNRGDGGKLDPTDRLVMAMARWRLGEKDAARTLFNQAAAEMAKNNSPDEVSLRLRAEVARLIGPVGATAAEDKEKNHPR
jgi:tetratricopeptide (TPR) repeat protein